MRKVIKEKKKNKSRLFKTNIYEPEEPEIALLTDKERAKLIKLNKKFDGKYRKDRYELNESIIFFMKNIASVEVLIENKIEVIMFKIPSYCYFLNE